MNLKEIKNNFKKYIRVYCGLYKDKRTRNISRFFLWLAISYFFLPFDIIPDFIPFLGQLDDIIIIPIFIYIALKFIPDSLYKEHYQKIFG